MIERFSPHAVNRVHTVMRAGVASHKKSVVGEGHFVCDGCVQHMRMQDARALMQCLRSLVLSD
jgi:hypothetical protein